MESIRDAVIVMAKCAEGKRTYGIRTERRDRNAWKMTWCFPINESTARREGYDKTTIAGAVSFSENYPGCPFCGGKAITVCSCGHIGCTILVDGVYTCGWCGAQGRTEQYKGESIVAGQDV